MVEWIITFVFFIQFSYFFCSSNSTFFVVSGRVQWEKRWEYYIFILYFILEDENEKWEKEQQYGKLSH